jgi:hypothetical protein
MPTIALKRYPRVPIDEANLQPINPAASADKFPFGQMRLRGDSRLVLYARKGDHVALKLYHGQVGNYSGGEMPVAVTDRSGKLVARGSVAFQHEGEVTFKAPATGLFHVAVASDGNFARLLGSSHPISLDAQRQPIHLIGTLGRLFFYVPAGTREFGIKVFGEGLGEGVKATLCDAAGRTVGQKDDVAQAQQFEIALPEPSKGEIWSLKTEHATHLVLEDYSIELLGIPALVAPSPEAILAPRK